MDFELTDEQKEREAEMLEKSLEFTDRMAEETSADFEAHAAAAAAAAEEREEVQLEFPVCHHKFASASACKAHVSTVVSAGCSGESLSAYAPHLFVSDLLCVCYVLLCVPALQHNKERDFPCQQCDHRSTSKGDLKSHVLGVVSAGCSGESLSVYAPHLFVSDLLCVCYVLLCVPLY
jgi:hypothetical protein